LALALLEYEASDHQRDKREAEKQAFSGSGHTVWEEETLHAVKTRSKHVRE
jgi:hypothetical protein